MQNHRIYSCDDHLDINAVPRDAWSSRLPSKYREAGPITTLRDGKTWWTLNGEIFGISGRWEGFNDAIQRVPGLDPDGMRAGDAKARLEDMKRDDIWASIVYGPNTLTGYNIPDPEHKKAVIHAYNDWAAEEFNSHAPGRLNALPMLPTTSPQDAVAELLRVVDLGHIGAIFHCFEVDLLDAAWDRLWAAAQQETGLPISFHIGGGTKLDPRRIEQRAMFAAIAPMQMDEPLAVDDLLRRPRTPPPSFTLVMAESGESAGCRTSWPAWTRSFEKHCVPYPGHETISTLPSEIFKRQVYATFEEEPLGPLPHPAPVAKTTSCGPATIPIPTAPGRTPSAAIEHSLGSLGEESDPQGDGRETCRGLYWSWVVWRVIGGRSPTAFPGGSP